MGELDGFDLYYEKYGDPGFGSGPLDEVMDRLRDKQIVRLYLTLYRDRDVPFTSALLDYIMVGDEVISFEPLEQEEIKDAPSSVSPGGQITYTITYSNDLLHPVDLVVRERYDPRTAFMEADPAPDPGTTDTWTFRQLPPGSHGQIYVKVMTFRPSCRASIGGSVTGLGYTSVRGGISTDFESYHVTNTVTIEAGGRSMTASASTRVRSIEGSTLSFEEHGPGHYLASGGLDYTPTSISFDRELHGTRVPVSVLPVRDPIIFDTEWSAGLIAESRVRDVAWRERYIQAEEIDTSSDILLRKSQIRLETTAHLSGIAERSFGWTDAMGYEWLAGNFTLGSRAEMRWSSRRSSKGEDGLDCCPEIQEDICSKGC